MGGEKPAAISSEWKMAPRGGEWQASGTKVWPLLRERYDIHIVVTTVRAAAGSPQVSSVL